MAETKRDKQIRSHLRVLARQGRLVETAFSTFQQAVYPGAPPEQVRELRVAFFAGAAELYAVLCVGLDAGDDATERDVDFFGFVVAEIHEFHERTIKAIKAPEGKA